MSNRGEDWLEEVLDEARKLSKYGVGESIEGLARKLGKRPSEILKLNANENFFVPQDFLRGLLQEVVTGVDPRLYPIDETTELRDALSKYMRVPPEEIVIGAGSDQLIELVSQMLLRTGDEALSIAPTFSMYEHCVRILGANYRAVSLKGDFSLNVEGILASATPRARLLFLCSPNNPTANQLDSGDIEHISESFKGLVVVDEAYADFAEESIVNLTRKFENLIIFRTFSKAFGIAGLRLGYAVANQDLATAMVERFQIPFRVSLVALRMGVKLLKNIEVIKEAIRELKEERSRLIRNLNEISGVRAFDSETNFVLFEVATSSDKSHKALWDKGVIVRNIGRVLHLENCLRVTVAPSLISETFLAVLRDVVGD